MSENRPTRLRPGCGVEGCLFAAVAIFVLLLVGMLVIALFRFSQPPQPRAEGGSGDPSQRAVLAASTPTRTGGAHA